MPSELVCAGMEWLVIAILELVGVDAAVVGVPTVLVADAYPWNVIVLVDALGNLGQLPGECIVLL